MIKRIEVAASRAGRGGGPPLDVEQWRDRLAGDARAPGVARPRRITLCLGLGPGPGPGDGAAGAALAGVALEWFDDEGHVRRFEEWRAGPVAGAAPAWPHRPDDIAGVEAVVALEVVQRGADWLEAHRQRGGPAYVHLAVARRAPHLSAAEFSARWQGHGGRVAPAGGAPAVDIPPEARGQAYVQNHPLPLALGEWPYDAVNEVYFEDLAGLRRRAAWFEENVGDSGSADLVGERWFLCAEERVLFAEP